MDAVSPDSVHAVVNPVHAASGPALAALRRAAFDLGRPLVVHTTTPESPGDVQAHEANVAGARRVIVIGGDGTVRSVAGALASTGVMMGIIGAGTANLFARNLGLPRRPDAAARVALTGPGRRIDLGWAKFRRGEGWASPEPFCVVAGIGHDAATVTATSSAAKRSLGWLAYLVTGARGLTKPTLPMTLTLDEAAPREIDTWCVLAGNCGRLPTGIAVFPDADPCDGVLDVLTMPLTTPAHWAGVAAKGLLHLHRDVAALHYERGRTVGVRPKTAQPLHLDGDAFEPVDEVHISVQQGALLCA